jgi:two-component system aerobic respiration control sensor histidine kinase ArcB
MGASIETFFACILFVIVLLLAYQVFTIARYKITKDLSPLTLSSFFLLQFVIFIHAITTENKLLIVASLCCMLSLSFVVILGLFYYWRNKNMAISEPGLQEILDQLPGHVYWKNKEGVTLGCNSNNWKDFGLKSASEMLGKTDDDIFSKEVAYQIRQLDEEVMRTGKTKFVYESGMIGRGYAAEEHIYLSQKSPLRNKRNQIIGIIGISINVTQETYEIRDKLELLENVIAMMPNHVYWLNREGVYLGCNDNQAKTLGLASRKDIVGKRNADIHKAPLPEILDSINADIMKNKTPIAVEETGVSRRGEEAIFLSSKVPIYSDDQKVTGMVGISIDITERKRMEEDLRMSKEQAEAANQAKSSFLASISHELRTPLNGILGVADLLSRKGLTEKQKNMLDHIISSGKNLLTIVNDILDFSKLEAGKLTFKTEPFEPAQLLRRIYTDMHPMLGTSTKLAVQCDSAIPEKVMGDALRIRQVLVNLVNNAIKFTEKGTIQVNAVCESNQGNIATLYFSVTDSGIGIPKDKLHTIFERFSQLEGEVSEHQRRYGGTGLGLSICQHLLTAMGGEMGVESELGKGSTFWFRIPLAIAAESAAQQEENIPSIVLEPFSKSHHILVVEDEPVNQYVTTEMLKEFGCTYDVANDGKEALALFEQNADKYALVIMDMRLPDMTGVDITEKCRAMEHIKKQPPIVAMTANALKKDISKYRKAGIRDVMTKPIDRTIFYQVLKKHLEMNT